MRVSSRNLLTIDGGTRARAFVVSFAAPPDVEGARSASSVATASGAEDVIATVAGSGSACSDRAAVA